MSPESKKNDMLSFCHLRLSEQGKGQGQEVEMVQVKAGGCLRDHQVAQHQHWGGGHDNIPETVSSC